MDKPHLHHLNMAASEISSSELTPVTSSEGDYAHSPLSAGLQPQTFFYDSTLAQNMYQPQDFSLQYQSAQNYFPIDPTQVWVGSVPQQSYITPASSSSLPEQRINAPVSTGSAVRDYVPLAKRPSVSGSVHSTYNSDGEEPSTHDEASERRRERRRAQNRAAQRAFRARKEVLQIASCYDHADRFAGNYQGVFHEARRLARGVGKATIQ